MISLPFLQDSKFILTIGDDGAILSHVIKNKIINKLFALSAAPSDRREINALLLKNPKTPIYVLLDSIEQTYSKQQLPAVSAFNIGKLVKRRMERDFAKTDIKGAILAGREESGRRDWIYIFVSTPATPNILEWLEYLASLPNHFAGIHLLPIEMENVLNDINKAILPKNEQKKQWQFIVTHNKTGGFRQTILHNEKVVFTRLIRQGKESVPDIIAGNIEQEIVNTIDYLRRLGLGDEEPIDIFVIASKELKTSLTTSKIRGKPLLLFTPFEVAKLLGREGISGKDDKFADILLATVFAAHKPLLKLDNPRSKSINQLHLAYKITSIAILFTIPIVVLYSAYLIFNIFSLGSKIKALEDKKAGIEKEWTDIKNTG